jgi:hypothetical protein
MAVFRKAQRHAIMLKFTRARTVTEVYRSCVNMSITYAILRQGRFAGRCDPPDVRGRVAIRALGSVQKKEPDNSPAFAVELPGRSSPPASGGERAVADAETLSIWYTARKASNPTISGDRHFRHAATATCGISRWRRLDSQRRVINLSLPPSKRDRPPESAERTPHQPATNAGGDFPIISPAPRFFLLTLADPQLICSCGIQSAQIQYRPDASCMLAFCRIISNKKY